MGREWVGRQQRDGNKELAGGDGLVHNGATQCFTGNTRIKNTVLEGTLYSKSLDAMPL